LVLKRRFVKGEGWLWKRLVIRRRLVIMRSLFIRRRFVKAENVGRRLVREEVGYRRKVGYKEVG